MGGGGAGAGGEERARESEREKGRGGNKERVWRVCGKKSIKQVFTCVMLLNVCERVEGMWIERAKCMREKERERASERARERESKRESARTLACVRASHVCAQAYTSYSQGAYKHVE